MTYANNPMPSTFVLSGIAVAGKGHFFLSGWLLKLTKLSTNFFFQFCIDLGLDLSAHQLAMSLVKPCQGSFLHS